MNLIPTPSGIKIYNIAISKSLPEWLSEKQKRALRYDQEYRRRIELIQDLHFPTASSKIKVSKDGQYIIVTGVYPPQVKVYEVSQLSMKFERHITNEVVQFQMLSDDYSKIAFLRTDRTLEFHAQFGHYHQLRIPKFGRDLVYHPQSCNLFVGGATNQVYRLDLEQGMFQAPLVTDMDGVNACDINPVHQLLALGGEDGFIECWDPRSKQRVARKDIYRSLLVDQDISEESMEVSSVKFDVDGLTLAVGTSTGHCLLFDLRSEHPTYVKDHQYGFPIQSIAFHSRKVISSDKKIVKAWDRYGDSGEVGKAFFNIEPPANINDVCIIPNSGLMMMAMEQPHLLSYFIPDLGPAPKWCSFLDNETEELEANQQTLYDDYKFVTKEELEKLGFSKMIGTQYLKAYMHGYFMDMKLYKKLRAVVEPFEFDKYKKEKIKEKLDKEAETRIGAKPKRKKPVVNAKEAARMLNSNEKIANEVMNDPRFSKMFSNPDFEVDESHEKFGYYHSMPKKITAKDIEDHFEEVPDEDDDNEDEAEEEGEEEDGEDNDEEEDDEEDNEEDESDEEEEKENQKKGKDKVKFYELKSGHEHALQMTSKNPQEQRIPFATRLQNVDKDEVTRVKKLGNMQVTFVPQSEKAEKKHSEEQREEWKARARERRGIKDLKLPKLQTKRQRR